MGLSEEKRGPHGEKSSPQEEERMLNNNELPVSGSLLKFDQKEKGKETAEVRKEKRNISKNIFVCNFAFFLMFTSFAGLSIIQSSIVGPVGTIGLGVTFGSSVFACLLLAPVFIRLIGCKYCLVISFGGFLIWDMANFYPSWGTVIPAALICGLANGPLWTSQATYYTIKGLRYSELSGETEDAVIARFFGLFFFFLLGGTSVGCAITSGVLSLPFGEESSAGGPGASSPFAGNVSLLNTSLLAAEQALPTKPSGPLTYCGAGYCPGTLDRLYAESMAQNMPFLNGTNATSMMAGLPAPEGGVPKIKIYLLVGIHTALTLGAMILSGIFLDRLPKAPKPPGESTMKGVINSLTATIRQIKRKRQLLMTPLNIYAGLSQSFILAEISEAFVACPLGVELLGFVLMTYGMSACLTSMLCGFLIKIIGRIPIFTVGGLIRLGVSLFLLLWTPDPSLLFVFFIIPAWWAMGDGLYMSQLNGFYGVMFYDNSEGAFSTYRFWEGVGLVTGYVYNSILCVKYKILICIGLHGLGWFLYYFTEVLHKRVVQKKLDSEIKRASRECIDITDKESNV